jgi:methyl-accepting chemotaxis protein
MFGRRRKRKHLKTLPKKNIKHFTMEELSVTPQMIEQAIQQSEIPEPLKEALLSELPEFVEQVDEATQKIFNPSAVWLETIQFADYVSQLATHLREEHGRECTEEIAERLLIMAESFKDLAENAMEVLDKSQKVFKHGA